MRRSNTKATLAGVLGGATLCTLAVTNAFAQNRVRSNNAVDAADAPQAVQTADQIRYAPAGEGGIAGLSPVVYDNGTITPAGCAPTGCTGTISLLQNTSLGLNSLGAGAQATAGVNNRVADDFVLAQATDFQTIEFYMYQTVAGGITAPTITSVSVALHSGTATMLGQLPTANVLQSSTGGVVALETIWRSAETTNCDRRIQKITIDVSAWPDIAAGTYWLSWQALGTAASGPWQPSVPVCGVCTTADANGLQSITGAAFAAFLDTGGGVGCDNIPLAFPFTIRGDVIGGPSCPGDTDGDSDVDADDLTNVILQWGNTCPCNADVDDDNDVDSDDLTVVILEWGTPC